MAQLSKAETIARNCFQLPRLATDIEGFVGRYMQEKEGAYEREKKEQERQKALELRRRKDDAERILKLISITIYRDAEQISKSLPMDRARVNDALLDLITARKIRRTVVGGREVYCLGK